MCLRVFVKERARERGEHRMSEENNRFKVKRLWFPFLCFQIPVPPPIGASLRMFRLSLLGRNPAWTQDLTSGVTHWEISYAEWFLFFLSNTNVHRCLPRCEFLLREKLLCAAISMKPQNTLIIPPISCVLSHVHTQQRSAKDIKSDFPIMPRISDQNLSKVKSCFSNSFKICNLSWAWQLERNTSCGISKKRWR